MNEAIISVLVRDREAVSDLIEMLIAGADTFRVKPRCTVHGYEAEVLIEADEGQIRDRIHHMKDRKGKPDLFFSVKFYNPIV